MVLFWICIGVYILKAIIATIALGAGEIYEKRTYRLLMTPFGWTILVAGAIREAYNDLD